MTTLTIVESKRKEFQEGGPVNSWIKIGESESKIKAIIESLGYMEPCDFRWQYRMKSGIILDFAFPLQQVCVESDGEYHKRKYMRLKDNKKDSYLYKEGWVVIHIPDSKLDSYGLSFYRNLIKEVVYERTPDDYK